MSDPTPTFAQRMEQGAFTPLTHAAFQKLACLTPEGLKAYPSGAQWALTLDVGEHAYLLVATRTKAMRLFAKVQTLVNYLQAMGLTRFAMDTRGWTPARRAARRRPDRSTALKELWRKDGTEAAS